MSCRRTDESRACGGASTRLSRIAKKKNKKGGGGVGPRARGESIAAAKDRAEGLRDFADSAFVAFASLAERGHSAAR